jgi:hypothetical protein
MTRAPWPASRARLSLGTERDAEAYNLLDGLDFSGAAREPRFG